MLLWGGSGLCPSDIRVGVREPQASESLSQSVTPNPIQYGVSLEEEVCVGAEGDVKKQPGEVSVYPAVFLSSCFPEDQRPEVVPYVGPCRVHIVAGTQEKQNQNFSSSFSVLLSHGFGGLPLASKPPFHTYQFKMGPCHRRCFS